MPADMIELFRLHGKEIVLRVRAVTAFATSAVLANLENSSSIPETEVIYGRQSQRSRPTGPKQDQRQ